MAGNAKISQLTGAKRNGTSAGAVAEPDEELGLGAEMDEDDIVVTPVGYGAYTAEAFTPPTYQSVMTALTEPLDKTRTRNFKGRGGKKMTYLPWQESTRTLNRILGVGNWTWEVEEVTDYAPDTNGIPRGVRVEGRLSVRVPLSDEDDSRWVNFSSVGFDKPQSQTWEDYGTAAQSAERNSFRRCCAFLGEQFGLSLYDGDDVAETPAASTSSPSTPRGETSTTTTPDEVACEADGCEKTVRGYTAKGSGRQYSTADMVKFSQRDCDGHVFCYEHKNAYKDGWRPEEN